MMVMRLTLEHLSYCRWNSDDWPTYCSLYAKCYLRMAQRQRCLLLELGHVDSSHTCMIHHPVPSSPCQINWSLSVKRYQSITVCRMVKNWHFYEPPPLAARQWRGVFKINSDRPIPYAVDPGFLIFKTQPPLFELSCTQTNVCMNESKRWHNLQA